MVSATNNSPRIRYDPDSSHLIVGENSGEVVVEHDGTSSWVSRIEDVTNIRAAELKRILRLASSWSTSGDSDDFEVVEGLEPGFDVEYTGSDIHLTLVKSELVLELVVGIDEWIDDDDELIGRLQRVTEPVLARARATIVGASMLDGPTQGPWVCSVTVLPSLRGRTVGDLYRLGKDMVDLLSAAASGDLNLCSVVHLVRAGRAELLIGQAESQWLDVKSQDYNLDDEAGKISLAQDVARFANSESGGAVVVGMRTRKLTTGEIIQALTPVPHPRTGVRRHRQAIDNRLFPPPDGLAIYEVPVLGGAMIVVHVPPQPEEHKPFLVHGAIVGGKVEGAFISILRRRGDESIPITAASIHATLAAGRALLRRGELPTGRDR